VWRLAQLCIFTAHVGKTTQQQHNWQNCLHFPPLLCSKSHEETMVSHWLIDSSSPALSSQHPETLRLFPGEVKNIKHDRYFPQGLERSNPHKNCPHTRETCWASCHTRRLCACAAGFRMHVLDPDTSIWYPATCSRLSCHPTFPTFSYFSSTFLLFLFFIKNCLIFLLF
jgi:hypothetical protein